MIGARPARQPARRQAETVRATRARGCGWEPPPRRQAPTVQTDESTCTPGFVPALRPGAAIHLGLPLPAGSSGLPAGSGGPPSNACAAVLSHGLLTLLRVGFTEPPRSPGVLVVSYTTVSPLPPARAGGGLFSAALSRGSPRVAVDNH